MWNATLDEAQEGIKTAERNISDLRHADDSTRLAESKGETKEPLDKGERGEWKRLKLNIQKLSIIASDPITSLQIDRGKNGKWPTLFSWTPKSLRTVTAAMKLKDACSLEENSWHLDSILKKQIHHFADKGPYSQNYGFPRSYVGMWELDHKEG